jgi:hypothetical protein
MSKRIGRGLSLGVGVVLMVACGAAVGVGGCAADTGSGSPASSSPADSLKVGLTILSSDPAIGVSAAYKANGRVVYLETRVGQLKEQPYRDAFPKDPMYEMDARVVDQEGRTFSLVIGGDHLIDPTWSLDVQSAGRIKSAAEQTQRDADFSLARDAAREFAAQTGPEFGDHVYHLSNMTARVPSEDAQLQRAPATEHPVIRDYGDNCSSDAQEIQLYTIALLQGDGFLGGIVGDVVEAISGAQHSTTWGWNYNGCTGGWDEQLVACNHGTCANSGTMSYSCTSYSGQPHVNSGTQYWSFSGSDLYSYEAYEANNTTTIGGGCSTHYGIDIADITIYGGGDSNHVCNDDSARELDQIRYIRTDANNWSGGSGGWNGNFNCDHSTHWYGPLDTDAEAPNCP